MAASNAERQAKWRERQKQLIAELEAKVAKLEQMHAKAGKSRRHVSRKAKAAAGN